MKLWQCSACREASEDCKNQCQLITDDDIQPTECVKDLLIFTNWMSIEVVDLLDIKGLVAFDRRKPTIQEMKLYQRAWDIFGKEPQMDMIIEECSELIKEVCKLKRHSDRSYSYILDEIVDVTIMCEQFLSVHKIFPAYHRRKRTKLIRLHIKLDSVEREIMTAEVQKIRESMEEKDHSCCAYCGKWLYDHKSSFKVFCNFACSEAYVNEDVEKEVKKGELWVVDPSLHAKRVN